MILPDLIASVRDRLNDPSIPQRTIEAAGNTMLRHLAEEAAHGPHARDFQREATALTLDGSGAVAVPSDILPGYISRITHPDVSEELVLVKDRGEFSYQICGEFGLAAIEQGTIYTKPPVDYQAGTNLVGDIAVTGIAIPTLATLKSKYDQDLIDLVVGVVPSLMKAPAKKGAT